jgi:formiminotetrahydrofolate cyclodeaminase
MAVDDYLALSVSHLLDQLAERSPAPAGGSAAGIAVAMAAALVAMAARFSTGHWEGAGGAVAQAEALRARTAPLARRDAAAYAAALETLRSRGTADPERRDRLLGDALSVAADVPLDIASAAADVAELAAEVAEHGNPNLRADAAAAAMLAEAGARVAAMLVGVNLTMRSEDERIGRARSTAEAAAAAARRAVAATA